MRVGSPEFLSWLAQTPCDVCAAYDLQLIWVPGLVIQSLGTYSLAGAMTKVSAREMLWPLLVCPACHRVCRGQADVNPEVPQSTGTK